MLILGRKVNQSVDLYDRRTGGFLARVTLVETRQGEECAIGIDALDEILVLRSELGRGRVRVDGNSGFSRKVGQEAIQSRDQNDPNGP